MKTKFKRIFLIFTMFFILFCVNVNAETEYFTGRKSEHERKDVYLSGITEEMCKADYWKDKNFIDINQLLMDYEEIDSLNYDIVEGSGTMVFDLEAISETFDADSRRNSLASSEIPTRDLYINGEKIDNQKYFGNLNKLILDTGYTGKSETVKYGICINRADLKAWPTDDKIGYSATDKDDEMQSSAMNINEPFLIRGKCEIDGKTFYWGNSTNCTGWTNSDNIAICETKEEWTNYWKVKTDEDNFVTVIGSRIILENSNSEEVQAMLGSVFKLVPDEEIPADLNEFKDDNYIVYFSGKDLDGKAEKRFALLSKDLELNKGYLPLTQNNILDVAFSCIGDEYGWAGMNGNMDCSLYTRSIYKCFGIELPRNTTWQLKVPKKVVDTSKMGIEEKKNYLSTLPAGSLFYISGHTMVYIGIDEDNNFVVSDLGTVVDKDGEKVIKDVYAVTVNSLDVRRANGTTWLENITGVVSFMDPIDINDCEIEIETSENIYDGTEKKPKVKISYNGKVIYENSNYSLKYTDNVEVGTATIEITGINNFTGKIIKTFEIEKKPEEQDNQDEKQDDNENENENQNVGGSENSNENENQNGNGNTGNNENVNQDENENQNQDVTQEENIDKGEPEVQKPETQEENTYGKVTLELPKTGYNPTLHFIMSVISLFIIIKIVIKIHKKENE